MKRKSLLVTALALAVGLLVFPLVSCGEVSFTTARLSEMTMAASIDETTAQPIDKTDTFSVDTPQIFVSVKVSNAPSETNITSKWIYVSGDVADLENYTIDTASVAVEGTRYVYFYRPMPKAGWPKGSYKVVFSIDDKEQGSVPFTVK